MARFGKLDEFKVGSESIRTYIEQVELFFEANEIPEQKQVAVFLSVVGSTTYTLLRDLLAPTKPQEKSLSELFKTLEQHYEPKPLVIAQRFYFYRRNQKQSESIAEYVAELRKAAALCEFGEFLNDALRDRFVCGLLSEGIQKRLLTEEKLTFAKAIEIAQGLEAAEKSSKRLQGHENEPIGIVSSNQKDRKPPREVMQFPRLCYRCGESGHAPTVCRFREAVCRKCKKKGHIARVCQGGRGKDAPSKKSTGRCARNGVHGIAEKELFTTMDPVEKALRSDLTINVLQHQDRQPILIHLKLNGKPTTLELDTGAAVSLMSKTAYQRLLPRTPLKPSTTHLTTYLGKRIPLAGEAKVEVSYGSQREMLTLFVVKGEGPSLLGREWLRVLRLDWRSIKTACVAEGQTQSRLNSLLLRYPEVFKEGSGSITTFKASLQLKPGSSPKFCKARPVPFALKQAVERELDRLEGEGIIEKVSHSQWAAPVVPVPKNNGQIRLCGDYKMTVNPKIDVDQYPLPRPAELFTTLTGGKIFSKIDLTNAYQQMVLEESARDLVTINTHRGLYRYCRLPFGVASAPAIFQKMMDQVLQGLPKVICYLDDILVSGESESEHLEILERVLKRLQAHNIRANKAKCTFFTDSVEYLGHRIDAAGLHTTASKVRAVKEAQRPRNIQQLRSFLGLLHYYGKFLHNLADLLHPLNALLRKGQWKWTEECERVFQEAKTRLSTAPVLAHFDPSLPLKMAGDASAYGLGAVLSQVSPDGSERPIAFASRTLSPSERNYSQIEKEALALVYGVKYFHQFLYGHKFTLVTDHKPLLAVLGPKTGIPPVAAARMQRWALLLSAYSYNIEFRPTGAHANADSLSRLPLKCNQWPDTGSDFTIGQVQALPVTASEVETATRQDLVLSKVHRFVRQGWPFTVEEVYKPFSNRRLELSTEGHCLLWGNRVVIPQKLRKRVLDDLHRDHSGMVRMKAIARSYFWWPGLDKEVEDTVQACMACQSVRNAPAPAPLHPWLWPPKPWQRVHLDFAGPFMGKMFLLAVDAHSKWPEVIEMTSTTAQRTVEEVRQLFASHGLPEQIVTDNGPQFVSEDFAKFLRENGVKHIRCSPYHPSSNGLVERFVQTFKSAMKTGVSTSIPLRHRLSNFLLTYRSTPHATTSRAPCELFLQRRLRTRFDLLYPHRERKIIEQQAMQKANHDRRPLLRELTIGQKVMVRNYRSGTTWIPGEVTEKLGPLTYRVKLQSGSLCKRHIDQLRELSNTATSDVTNAPDVEAYFPSSLEHSRENAGSSANASVPLHQPEVTNQEPASERRYPQREHRPPERYSA